MRIPPWFWGPIWQGMKDEVICGFMNRDIYEEIIPTLSLPEQECLEFAAAVTDRFNNPFIDHELLSIALNSTSKWKARVLPSLKGYVEKLGALPACLTASLAFYLAFYRGVRLDENGFFGVRGNEEYKIMDDRNVLEFYNKHKDDDAEALTQAALGNTDFWGEDLTRIPGLCEAVSENLKVIGEQGAYELMRGCLA